MKFKKVLFISGILFFSIRNPFFIFAQENNAVLVQQENSVQEQQENQITFNIENDAENLSGQNQTQNQKTWSEKKHPVAALSGALGFNVLLSTWNRYMIGSEWAKTGPEEWCRFWERELEWDTDWYWTNFFLHPYQGAQYYMASRSANMNRIESFGITTLGALMWEYLCEKNLPSKNDVVYTTVASFCVGEMFYRLSLEASSYSKLLGIAFNPQRLYSEYVWQIKQKPTTGNIHALSIGNEIGNVVGNIKTHTKGTLAFNNTEIYPFMMQFFLNTDYNDPYTHDSNVPYSQFSMNVKAGLGAGSGVSGPCTSEDVDSKIGYEIRIFSDAMLWARSLQLSENTESSFGITMIYDFDWHSYYMVSSIATGLAFKQRVNFPSSKLEWQAQTAYIILGNTEYIYWHRKIDFVPESSFRTYSYTIGAEGILKAKYTTSKNHVLDFNMRSWAMYDFYNQKQLLADTGWEFLTLFSLAYEIPVSKEVSIDIMDEVLAKTAVYKELPSVQKIANSARIYAKLQLK